MVARGSRIESIVELTTQMKLTCREFRVEMRVNFTIQMKLT